MAGSKRVRQGSEGKGLQTTGYGDQSDADGAQEVEELPEEIRRIVEEDSEDRTLSLDEIFELLKNERRRKVIYYLLDAEDGTATLSDLAEHIAAEENDIPVKQLSSDQRKRVYIGLYQCHLPKLDEFGIIDFEDNRGDVELNGAVEQVLPYLDRTSSEDASSPPPTVELGITMGVLGVMVFAVAGIGPLSGVSPMALATISTLALIGVALYQVAKVL